MNTTTADTPADALRASMVDEIKTLGHARTKAVEEAMRAVPRHRFVPAVAVEDAYADIAVVIKEAADGSALSLASVPSTVAMMLDQLDVQPGHRILEIGAGTGYNAALLAHLTGPTGHVTTVDIDSDVTAHAREALDATGNEEVTVISRDGALAADENAPYDRIIFTVGALDIPAAIWQQLAPGGQLVLPLRWRGQTRSVALARDGETLRAYDIYLCGFVPMIGQDGEKTAAITDDGTVSLYWDADQAVDPAALHGVLDQPKYEAWSGVTVGGTEPFDGVWLRLTATEPATCRIAAEQSAIQSEVVKLPIASRTPALVEGDSLGYFTVRRLPAVDGTSAKGELGAIGHGPAGQELAKRLCEHIRIWGIERDAIPQLIACPPGTADTDIPHGHVIDKPETRLVLNAS